MKKILLVSLLGVSSFVNAEFVTNANGEKVELKDDGTWAVVKLTNEDYVLNANYYDITLKDGNGQDIVVNVLPNINLKDGEKLTRERAVFAIRMTEIPISHKLKNRYSYTPKKVYINQVGNSVKITIEYIAKNSYGADTVGSHSRDFTLDEKGRIHLVVERS